MSAELWQSPNDRGSVLTTQLNALANGAVSAAGAEVDNATNKDRWAVARLSVTFGTNPTAEAAVTLFCIAALDGSNYPEVSAGALTPSAQYEVGTFQVRAVTTPQVIDTAPFILPGPFKLKFMVKNSSGFAMPATGTTVGLRTFNREIN